MPQIMPVEIEQVERHEERFAGDLLAAPAAERLLQRPKSDRPRSSTTIASPSGIAVAVASCFSLFLELRPMVGTLVLSGFRGRLITERPGELVMADKKGTERRDQIDRRRRKQSGRALLIAVFAAIMIILGFVLMIYFTDTVERLGGTLTLSLTRT
ncbi:hypothetical protein [Rhizobium azibense]|uniref:hypothetical protein n=1 Tax=Rhizobium azibense TaxID=1136135 RepID=UPI001FE0E9E4|nr:hypothetical protein [Rhizobium azibense]